MLNNLASLTFLGIFIPNLCVRIQYFDFTLEMMKQFIWVKRVRKQGGEEEYKQLRRDQLELFDTPSLATGSFILESH
mgnify:CR=1 FL=1